MTIIEDANKYLHEKTTAYMTKERRLERSAVLIEKLVKEIEQYQKDAARYRYLRSADIDAVYKGGIFAGQTPENLVVNGEDLDIVIDEALSQLEDK